MQLHSTTVTVINNNKRSQTDMGSTTISLTPRQAAQLAPIALLVIWAILRNNAARENIYTPISPMQMSAINEQNKLFAQHKKLSH